MDDREQARSGIVEVLDDAGIGPVGDHVAEGKTAAVKVGAMLALAALILVGVAVVVLEPPRTSIDRTPSGPSPTFSRNDSGTPLPTEAEAWGAIWSQTHATAVLRPTWLPRRRDDYQLSSATGAPNDASLRYSVTYVELRSVPGSTVWNVEFLADPLEEPRRGLQEFGGAAQDVKIRGGAGELFGNGSPGWTLAWIEGNYRYAIQAFGVSREDLLRIADSLAPVVDASGRTTRSGCGRACAGTADQLFG
jgi:hypothetical protein